MLSGMSKPLSFDAQGEIIEVNSPNRKRRRWRWWLLLIIIALLIVAGRAVSIYVSALWFGSLGYSQVYWYMFRLKIELFVVFLILTTAILRGGFWLIERAFGSYVLDRRTVFINRQPVNISPARVLRPLAWILSIITRVLSVYAANTSDNQRMAGLRVIHYSLRRAGICRAGIYPAGNYYGNGGSSPAEDQHCHCLMRFSRVADHPCVARLPFQVPIPLGRSPDILRRDLHGSALFVAGPALCRSGARPGSGDRDCERLYSTPAAQSTFWSCDPSGRLHYCNRARAGVCHKFHCQTK